MGRNSRGPTLAESHRKRGVIELPDFPDKCSDVQTETVTINETISELAYLTHNYYRYYGKFPSKLARVLLERFGKPGDLVLDNYAGSGTTLVEAKIAGVDSIGTDINPCGVLAANVKTRTYDQTELGHRWSELRHQLGREAAHLGAHGGRPELIASDSLHVETQLPQNSYLTKWFSAKRAEELAFIKDILRKLPADEYKEFFVLAFLAIIRRASNAYDGEVRPHINPQKRPRPGFEAYFKKVDEMVRRNQEFGSVAENSAISRCYLWDAQEIEKLPALRERQPTLVISHPPYLNCFNYIPTFKLDLMWAGGFEDLQSFKTENSWNYAEVKEAEIQSWPATDKAILSRYFEQNRAVYRTIFEMLAPGGRCCIVIGDATVHHRLIRTHKIFARFCEDIGFRLESIIYRTTHFGTGKYAYNHRADYHSDEGGKKDGTLVLSKPL